MKKGLLYTELAKYYDRIYSRKDYKAECAELRRLIQEYKQTPGQDLLEVGCGTGLYLEHFQEFFTCTGVDLSPEMLRVAKKRLSGSTLRQADMRGFDLGQEFDVVLCLFSSIANLGNYSELRKTMLKFSRHLKPGGVLILGPWKHPENVAPGASRLFTYESEDLKLARLDFPKRKGPKTILDFHWLVAEKGKKIQYIEGDHHELMEFTEKQYLDSMRTANLSCRYIEPTPPASIGLYVGTKIES